MLCMGAAFVALCQLHGLIQQGGDRMILETERLVLRPWEESDAPECYKYASDPATLARDLARFAERGYIAERLTAVDMFPRTRHVETVVLMTKE